MLELCRYIHRNPVDDRIVNSIDQWEFSNYLEWTGERNGDLIDSNLRNKYFPKGEGYTEYVKNYWSNKQAKNELRKYLFEIKFQKKS